MSGDCEKCGEHTLDCVCNQHECRCEKYITALKSIFRILDNLKYECCAREYTLDQDEMGWIFYCRDTADIVLRHQGKNENL
jgi:hypothetical protein